MKYSAKGVPPQSFVDWMALASPDWTPTYRDLRRPQSEDVRDALLAEQTYVCCYCGRGLNPDRSDSHTDHFRPQKHYSAKTGNDLTLDYGNFLASCGPPKVKAMPSTCGDAKGSVFDEAAHVAPWDPGCERRFFYGLAGEVTADPAGDAGAEKMIEMLNLNDASLVDDRAKLLAGLETLIDSGEIAADAVDEEIDRWRSSDNGRRKSFSHVAVRYLEVEFGLP